MSDSNPLVGILALVFLVVAILVIVPVGPGELVIPEHEDYDQMWQDTQVDNRSLDFSVGLVLLVANLALMLGVLSYALLTYRGPDDGEPWRDLSHFEDEE